MQNVPSTGPLPQGDYTIRAPRNSANTGPAVRDLVPNPNNQMHGRADFQIHGNNAANDASRGCVILPRNVRDAIPTGETLRVTP